MEPNKTFALVLYTDITNTGSTSIHEIVCVSSDKSKLEIVKEQKEHELQLIAANEEIDEEGSTCWCNNDVSSLNYEIIELNVV